MIWCLNCENISKFKVFEDFKDDFCWEDENEKTVNWGGSDDEIENVMDSKSDFEWWETISIKSSKKYNNSEKQIEQIFFQNFAL